MYSEIGTGRGRSESDSLPRMDHCIQRLGQKGVEVKVICSSRWFSVFWRLKDRVEVEFIRSPASSIDRYTEKSLQSSMFAILIVQAMSM